MSCFKIGGNFQNSSSLFLVNTLSRVTMWTRSHWSHCFTSLWKWYSFDVFSFMWACINALRVSYRETLLPFDKIVLSKSISLWLLFQDDTLFHEPSLKPSKNLISFFLFLKRFHFFNKRFIRLSDKIPKNCIRTKDLLSRIWNPQKLFKEPIPHNCSSWF